MSRFRIRPECVDDVLSMLRDTGINPIKVYDRDDGAVAVEIGEITDEQGQKLAVAFRPEWSAIIGIVGGNPHETRH